jgi:pimeloyl-ACP methyl ester carboxylesterase
MPTIEREGVRIAYDVAGDGPPVLLSHGYTATGAMWRPQVESLVAQGYRVITWDERGHGRSDYPEDPAQYAESIAVADMAAVLDAAGAQRAVIGGLSLGGYLSLAFHLQHPERTVGLVLMDTGPGFKSDEARDRWNEYATGMGADFEARGLDALADRAEVDRSHRDASGLVRAATGLLRQRDARIIESLPTIAVPTLVLVGEQDTGFLAGAEYMAKRIPGATHVVVPDAGHAANLDQPERVNDALLAFLGRLRSTGDWT